MQSHNWLSIALCSLVFGQSVCVSAIAAPRRNDAPKQMKHSGARREGPLGVRPVLILDNATRARGRAAAAGMSEALIVDQPHDSGFGWFMKSDDTLGRGTFAMRMQFANGFAPGDSFTSYEATFFHSTSDDIWLGDMDVSLELWDGDPASIMETTCTVGGVSAPIPGTDSSFSIPYGAVARLRAELPVKVTYDCELAWLAMQIDTACRGAWRLSGQDGDSFNAPPTVGSSNGIWLAYPCEAFSACPTNTGRGVGICCGIRGTCSGSGAECRFEADCPDGENCEGLEACDEGSDVGPYCSCGVAFCLPFCGSGVTEYFLADYMPAGEEMSYVATLFAATNTTMSVVPVSVDAPASTGNFGAGVVSLGGDEVVLEDGGHNVWLEIRIGDWDPHDLPDNDPAGMLAGYQPAIDAAAGFVSGTQGTLDVNVGGAPCGECADNQTPCFSDAECTSGTCSGSGDPCTVATVLVDCPSGETCNGAAACVATATGNDDCAAALGPGSHCGPLGYFHGSGSCAWTFTDSARPDWALKDAYATLAALDVSTIDSRPSYAVVLGPARDPEPFPADGLYAATMSVHVPLDAKGTFTIGLRPYPLSTLDSGAGPPIPLLGVIPAKITIPTGRCCFDLQDVASGGEGCFDKLQTGASCAQFTGLTVFEPGATCDDPCPPVCGDGLLDAGEECDDGMNNNSDTLADACRNDCTLPICGDHARDTGEECDLGVTNSDTAADRCRTDCTLPICGDGVVDNGENCDGETDTPCTGACADDCTCPTTTIPASSHWGLSAMALLLLTCARRYRRRQTAYRSVRRFRHDQDGTKAN